VKLTGAGGIKLEGASAIPVFCQACFGFRFAPRRDF